MKSTAILIPARYDNKRFPGKPLAMLDGIEINAPEDAEKWNMKNE